MSHAATQAGPQRKRFESLDVLRGVAVLGIFMVNVQTFAMTPYGYANPVLEADFGPEGRAVWVLVVTFFQAKLVTLFATMFGAGVLLMSGEGEDWDRTALHVRRMKWLLVIGLVHALAFWYGDILAPYAVAGLAVTAARGWGVRRLVAWGVVLTLLTSLLHLAAGSSVPLLPEDQLEDVMASWAPSAEAVAERQDLFRSPWIERAGPLAGVAAEHEIDQLIYYLPRFAGLMLIGMALLKTGFLTGVWPAGRYAALALLAPLGAAGSWACARMQIDSGFELLTSTWAQGLLHLVSLPQALGYAAIVMLVCKPAALAWARAPFAAAGRCALSCYLGCTLLGWLVFYGPPGFGRIGHVTRLDQVMFVVWTWAGMLVLAPLWLQVFAFGPFEWLWRSLTYGRFQPCLRVARASEPA